MTEKNIRPSCQTRRMLASACSSISARVMVDSSPLLRLRFLSVMADRSCYVTFCTTRVHALRRMHDRDVLRVLPVKVNVPLCVLPADALGPQHIPYRPYRTYGPGTPKFQPNPHKHQSIGTGSAS